jgi:hypothetical protein
MLQWLSPPDLFTNHNIAYKANHGGTALNGFTREAYSTDGNLLVHPPGRGYMENVFWFALLRHSAFVKLTSIPRSYKISKLSATPQKMVLTRHARPPSGPAGAHGISTRKISIKENFEATDIINGPEKKAWAAAVGCSNTVCPNPVALSRKFQVL